MAQLGRGIDELQVDLFQMGPLGMGAQSFAQGDDTFLGADDLSLDHEPIFVDQAIMGEATQGVDTLFSQIRISGSTLVVTGLANAVDLLVDFSTVVVPVLYLCV